MSAGEEFPVEVCLDPWSAVSYKQNLLEDEFPFCQEWLEGQVSYRQLS